MDNISAGRTHCPANSYFPRALLDHVGGHALHLCRGVGGGAQAPQRGAQGAVSFPRHSGQAAQAADGGGRGEGHGFGAADGPDAASRRGGGGLQLGVLRVPLGQLGCRSYCAAHPPAPHPSGLHSLLRPRWHVRRPRCEGIRENRSLFTAVRSHDGPSCLGEPPSRGVFICKAWGTAVGSSRLKQVRQGGGDGEGGGGLTHDLAGPSLTSAHINPAWKAVASVNMLSCAFVAADPVHEEMSRLNAEAP